LDEDVRLNRLINFSFFGFQNTDLNDILCNNEIPEKSFVHLEEHRDQATAPLEACFLGFLSCLDSTYLMYAYQYKKTEYAFAWESFYDDSHRLHGSYDDPPWYEFIEQGQMFEIRLNPKIPEQHIVTERPFAAMNDTVICLGTTPCL
jgi:hypothetical protein